jgi:hypothetical protein
VLLIIPILKTIKLNGLKKDLNAIGSIIAKKDINAKNIDA